MKTISLLLTICLILTIGLTSATTNITNTTITQDIFSDQVTRLEIEISNNQSIVNFEFNSQGYEWDEFNVSYNVDEYTNLTLKHLFLSDLLSSINFKIINNPLQFTYLNIETPSLLQAIVDNVLSMTNQSFQVSDLNNNLTLVNSFFEADVYFYQTFEKTGNNYIYTIDKGHSDVNVSEIIEESLQVFNISNILSDVGIENIYNLAFTTELNLDIPLENGEYVLNLQVIDGESEYNKDIYLTLSGFEEEEEEVVVVSSSSSSSKDDDDEDEIKIKRSELQNGKVVRFKKGEIVYFTLKQEHKLEITSWFFDRVFFKIQSSPAYFNLTQGEGINLCLSETESIFVQLERIGNNYVDLFIQEDDLSLCNIVEEKIITKQDVTEIDLTGAEPNEDENNISIWIKLLIGIILSIIFVVIIFILTRKKKEE